MVVTPGGFEFSFRCVTNVCISLQALERKLIAAAADGSTEEVIMLLDGGVNVDATDEVRCSCQLAFIQF